MVGTKCWTLYTDCDQASENGRESLMGSANETDDPAGEAEALEYGRWLFAQACAFILGAAELGQVPETALPEVALAGRSNVGKSSLVNALTGRRTLARISNSPGRTQQLNFFVLGDRLMLADLPGYGYASALQGPRSSEWTAADPGATSRAARNCAGSCLLIDSRATAQRTRIWPRGHGHAGRRLRSPTRRC